MSKNDNDDQDFPLIEDLDDFDHQEDKELDAHLESYSEHHQDNPSSNEPTDRDSVEEQPSTEELAMEEESGVEEANIDESNPEKSLTTDWAASDETFEQAGPLDSKEGPTGEDNSEQNPSDIESQDNTIETEATAEKEGEADTETKAEVKVEGEEEIESEEDKENFADVKNYAESISQEKVPEAPNPPYSLILNNILYTEDVEEIKAILKEYAVITQDNEKLIEDELNNQHLLIPQMSEYTAISILHRFKKLDLDIVFGLSEELHPPENYTQDARGLISKKNLHQNVKREFFLEQSCDPEEIVLTTTPFLEGYHIQQYLGIVTEHSLTNFTQIEIHDEDQHSSKIQAIYDNLAENLKLQASKLHANGVVGIQYELRPLVEISSEEEIKYKITCTGNAVWVVDVSK